MVLNVFLIYLRLVLLTGGLLNILIRLFLLEIISWRFIFLLDNFSIFKYLIVQSIFLILRILGIFINPRLLILGFLVKIGLPPFHLWFINLTYLLEKWRFIFITTLHKILPLIILIKIVLLGSSIILRGLIIILRGVIILQMGSFFHVVIVSSIIHSGWIMTSYLTRIEIAIFYWRVYSFTLLVFLGRVIFFFIKFLDFRQTLFLSILWLILSGIPPFTIFWLKVNVLSLFLEKRIIIGFIVVIVSILTLRSYYRVYHTSLSLSKRVIFKYIVIVPLIVNFCIG